LGRSATAKKKTHNRSQLRREAAEECQLVGETLIITYTHQIFIYAKYVF